MKHVLLIALVLLVQVSALGDELRVIGSEKGDPIAAAHVYILSHVDSSEHSGLTDDQGMFTFNTSFPITVQVSHLGFRKYTAEYASPGVIEVSLKHLDFDISETVVTAQYAEDNIDNSVYEVTIISREEIEQRGSSNLREILSTSSEIDLSSDGILGTGMSIQGVSGQGVKYLINGVPIVGRLNGQIDLGQINLNNVERIEIVEGPLAAVYGSDALGGVVNIITSEPIENKLAIEANGLYESVGQYNVDALVSYSKKQHHIQIDGGRYFNDGVSFGDSARSHVWKPKEQYFVNGMYKFSLPKLDVKLEGGWFNERIYHWGEPFGLYGIHAFDHYYDTERPRISLGVDARLPESKFLNVNMAYSGYVRHRTKYFKDLTTLEQLLVESPGANDTSKANFYMAKAVYSLHTKEKRLTYQFGVDVNHEETSGNKISGGVQGITDMAAFASFNFAPSRKLSIQPTARIIYNSAYDAPVVPSLNVKFKPNDDLIIRAAYGLAYRAPSVRELYLYFVDANHDIVGNTDLKPEIGHTYQASIGWKTNLGDSKLRLKQKVFLKSIKDKIELFLINPETFSLQYHNVQDYRVIGANSSVEWSMGNWNADLGVNVLKFTQQIQNSSESISAPLMVSGNSSLRYTYQPFGLEWSAHYGYNGVKPIFTVQEDGSIQQNQRSAYHILDSHLSKSFYDKRMTIGIGVKNIFDVKTVDAGNSSGAHSTGSGILTGWGRSFVTTLKLRI